MTSDLVANSIALCASSWLTGAFGRRNFFLTCIAAFTACSILCGLAQDLTSLLIFRVLQGLAGGGMTPVAQSILADAFPPNKRSQAFAIYGVAIVVAPVVGPVLGGWLSDNWSWNWCFFINGPVGLASIVARAAYRTQSVWGHTLARLCSATFRLSGAQVSSSGRLSLSQKRRAEAIQPFRASREEITAWARNGALANLVHMSWPSLADHLARCFAPSLDRPPLSAQPVVLLPSRIAPVAFDDLTQRLRWPLMDLSGAWISLTLDHNDEGRGLGASRIAALEAAIGDSGNKRPFAIVAIARPEDGKIALEPMALWGETQTSLDFPDRIPPPETDIVARIMAGLRRKVARFAPPPPDHVSVRQTSQLLQTGIDALISFAEAGLHASAQERILAPLARTYQLASLTPLAQLFSRTSTSREGEISSAALATAQGLFTLQSFSSRLQVW